MSLTRRARGALGLVALVVAMSAVAADPTDSDETETLPLRVYTEDGDYAFRVEVARTLPERSRGLMERERLDEDAGMLFLYREPQSGRNGFWMYRTRIPLDIAFIDAAGRIAALHTMQPCDAEQAGDCPVTRPLTPYAAALEVNAGTFERLGIQEGDCVSWPGNEAFCRSPEE